MNKMYVSMDEILTNALRRTHSNGHTQCSADYDVFISVTPASKKRSTQIRFNYHYKWIKNFNCVTLSRVGNNLFFVFSETDENGIAYVNKGDKFDAVCSIKEGKYAGWSVIHYNNQDKYARTYMLKIGG